MEQLSNYVWMHELCRTAKAKKGSFYRKLEHCKKITLGKFVFVEKSCVPSEYQEFIKDCTDLTNIYPRNVFFNELYDSTNGYANFLKSNEPIDDFEIEDNLFINLEKPFYDYVENNFHPFPVNNQKPESYASHTIFFQNKFLIGFF